VSHRTRAAARRVGVALSLAALAVLAIALLRPSEADTRAAHAQAAIRDEVAARFQQGVAMLHAKQPEYAAKAFHRVLELAPTMPEAHVNLGFALIGKGEARAARDFFRSAIALRPRMANAWYGRALASDALGDRTAAVADMRAYLHLASADDPFRRRAAAAVWEWESAGGPVDPGAVMDPSGSR
jgi:tetratricopeptide (TPR) repeat protein